MGTAAALRAVRFQFIYVIHGEGAYGFFDGDGARKSADAEALARADEVARRSADAEVFVFHQNPVRILGAFRIADGTMRLYRNGSLLRTENYRRSGPPEGLRAEADLYRKHAAGKGPEPLAARVFLYFGHGIPEAALPSFAQGLGLFADAGGGSGKPFSLVVLSACNGGSPAAISALAPFAYRILASPGELHLSYLASGALPSLARESRPPAGPALPGGPVAPHPAAALAERWGRELAEESFASLKQRTTTAITVALYDTDKAAAYVDARRDAWDFAHAKAASQAGRVQAYRDCAENPAFGSGGPESGASVFFRPARFGRDKARTSHSGWECPASG